MKTLTTLFLQAMLLSGLFSSLHLFASGNDQLLKENSPWYFSLQYLGITFHPGGGTTPEVYPLKFDRKAYVVVNVGAAANIDYSLNKHFFLRFTASRYKDCAFVSAGCFHLGSRLQHSWGKSSINVGMGPIFSYREDWHQFAQYTTDDFYGNRVQGKWQYRLFPCALELEYLHRINDRLEFQYSLIPGGALVLSSLVGVRYHL
ncbi:MAG: hypothetical protein U0T82_16280 [Bacteroidales bacterium]